MRRRSRAMPILAASAVCLAIGVLGAAQAACALTISVDRDHPGARIPSRFTGLSFEAGSLRAPWLDRSIGNVAKLVKQLKPPSLRFSANGVDLHYWTRDPFEPKPDWAEGILTPSDLVRGGKFARAVGAALDLGVNFAQLDPSRAADQAAAAVAAIGRTLRSFQIGNEPDLYGVFGVARNRTFYVYDTYKPDAQTYRDAINAAAPGIPIAGPDTSSTGPLDDPQWMDFMQRRQIDGWLRPYAHDHGGTDPYLNTHLYALTSCFGVPERGRLLSKGIEDGTVDFLTRVQSIARDAGLALHIDETNSSSCGGQGAEFSSFASALWIVDYVLLAAQVGVAELNFHTVRSCQGYSVFCFPDQTAEAGGRARAQPAYYGLMLVEQLLGSRFLPVTRDDDSGHVASFAAVAPDGRVRVVLVNMTEEPAGDVRVRVGRSGGRARIQRLTAPSMDASAGVRFAGASVRPNGSFTPRPGTRTRVANGELTVNLPAASAALITISPFRDRGGGKRGKSTQSPRGSTAQRNVAD